MSKFADRFISLAAERSPLCVGVDPSVELLNRWGLSSDARGVATFCDLVLEAAADKVAIFKPQSAFFARFGPAGLAELVRLGKNVRSQGSLFLIDCKRGDMGPSMTAYADAFLGPESPYFADAITIAPYLGFASLAPMLEKAAAVGAGIFVVVRSSNPSGKVLQSAELADGRRIADALADEITDFNVRQGDGLGPIGAVMGATLDEESAETLARMPLSLFLAPGIGAQGGTFAHMAAIFGPAAGRAIPSASRAILQEGPSVSKLRESIRQHQEGAHTLVAA